MDSLKPIPANQLCALLREDRGRYFRQEEKGGHSWVSLQDADILPRRRWLVAEGERAVPVRVEMMVFPLDVTATPAPGGEAPDLDKAEKTIETASKELGRLCEARWAGPEAWAKVWHWEIPASEERDTDLKIGAAIGLAGELVKEVRRLRAGRSPVGDLDAYNPGHRLTESEIKVVRKAYLDAETSGKGHGASIEAAIRAFLGIHWAALSTQP